MLLLLLLTVTASAMDLAQTLKDEEKLMLHVYKDSLGYWTIGYGHRCPANTKPITEADANRMLAEDIQKAKKNVETLVGADAPQEVKDIVTAMVFQLGFDGVKNFKKMLTAIHAKDYVTASKEMLDSKWNKQTPKRAKRMSDLMAAVK